MLSEGYFEQPARDVQQDDERIPQHQGGLLTVSRVLRSQADEGQTRGRRRADEGRLPQQQADCGLCRRRSCAASTAGPRGGPGGDQKLEWVVFWALSCVLSPGLRG